MKRRNKLTLISLGLIAAAFVASGCTANFTTAKETSRMFYVFEKGVSTFYVAGDAGLSEIDDTKEHSCTVAGLDIVQVYTYDSENKHFDNCNYLNSIIDAAVNIGTYIPSVDYFVELDKKVLNLALNEYFKDYGVPATVTQEELNAALKTCGYLKFYSNKKSWESYDTLLSELRNELGYEVCPTTDFLNVYKSSLNNTAAKYKSTITIRDGEYGNFNGESIYMEGVSWGDAWNKGGHLIEGLIVYPVAWLVDTFANLFAGGDPTNFSQGLPQILALLVVTVIVRLFIFLVTIKQTLSQQKMTALQPELAKIQQKYPNSNTNETQKQRLAEEQMRLYKKNGVNPLSSLLVLIVQFPVFIGVWGAMTGSAVLSTGKFLDLDLSQSIWECLKLGPSGHAGWWTALVLIILMSAGQFFSMKVPQWLTKARTKKVTRLAKNPAEKSQNRTANIVSYVMLFMIIFMGFTLPAAMGVYWLVGAIVSLIQSLIMNLITNRKHVR